jgi:hypothetical protein
MLRQRLGDDINVDGELAALEAEMVDEQAAAMPSVPTVRFPWMHSSHVSLPHSIVCPQTVLCVQNEAEMHTAEPSVDEPAVSEPNTADALPAAPTNSVSERVNAEAEATLVPA